jgi:hypothetical protein
MPRAIRVRRQFLLVQSDHRLHHALGHTPRINAAQSPARGIDGRLAHTRIARDELVEHRGLLIVTEDR